MTSVGTRIVASSSRSSSVASRIAPTWAMNGSGGCCSTMRASRFSQIPNRLRSRGPTSHSSASSPSAAIPPSSTASAHSCRSSRRHSWWRQAVQARTSERVRSGWSTPMIWAMTPPIDAPITWARSTPSASSTASASSAICSSEYGPGRAVAAAGAPVVEGVAAVPAPEGEPLEGPAPGVGAEALDHQQRRTRRGGRRRRSGS